MKKTWNFLGIIVLGMIFCAGCGDRQAGGISSVQPVETGGINTESNGQSDREQSGDKITLTLGTYETSWELTNAVEAYNARNGQYCVEIVDYGQKYQDYDVAKERLKLDLATSEGTDIIWVGSLVADELGYAGVLADLNAYLTPENREKYLTNILEYAQTGDALYEIAATFELAFIAGDSGKLGTETGWTIEEMLETFRANNKDANALGGVGVYTAQELVLHAIEDFVDWDSGRADFCNQEFYDILEFCRDESGWVMATQESVTSGTHLAVRSGISCLTDIQYTNWLLGDDWVVKGWPCNQGTGVKVSFYNAFAICSYSQCPEGAWDFLEYYITLDWLEEYAALHPDLPPRTYARIHGLPLNRLTFEEMLEWSTVQQYYETGEPVPFYFGEGSVPNFYANSEEDVERIREIVALADGRGLSNQSFVFQIIGEEISGYQTGGLSAEQTAEKIQNRVQLYLDEQKQ
ncbi:MAG: extracellular solute-binding protein [Lachnospiraceae bacterium]|nr:extracellular solute-binding protein [Lachnospiraceae bacterium]MBD5498301.1 extracellular solute-binding protein [Lachnospiraceae bacterium]MBD5510440.1 extracellular solute-binding protein [Lachnospiraceae bacterium]